MTKDQIIAAAKEVGAQQRIYKTSPGLDHFLLETEQLERFAAIIAKAEREECAKVCDQYDDLSSSPSNFANNCAKAIRARGDRK